MSFDLELAVIQQELVDRTANLEDAWRRASVADRLLACQRLMHDGRLSDAQIVILDELNACVQRLWTTLRRHTKHCTDAHDRLRILGLEQDVARAERDRDLYLDAEGLVEELFCCAETFFTSARAWNEMSYRDVVHERNALAAAETSAPQQMHADPQMSGRTNAHASPPETTQKMAIVYSLTGEQLHSQAA